MKRRLIAMLLLAGSIAAQTSGPNAKENALPTKPAVSASPAAPPDVAPNSSGYRIGEQDLLNITVWKERRQFFSMERDSGLKAEPMMQGSRAMLKKRRALLIQP